MAEPLRQVIVVDGLALHMRRLGAGPPVILLHESPRSSVVLLPLANSLAARFTVFAIDTPGYGFSDPLPIRRPEITNFADAIARCLRRAGLVQVPIYGTHTGATIAAEIARRHRDVAAGVVLDGYPLFTTFERDLHHQFYLPEFEPAWDGSHVMRLWARVRDQYSFFPWYLPGDATRLDRDPPTPEQQTMVVGDFLSAGRHYASAYAASFRFDARETLRHIAVPVHIVSRADDLLFEHLERPPELPEFVRVERLGTDRLAWAARIADLLGALSSRAQAPAPFDSHDGNADGLLASSGGDLLLRRYETPTAIERPLLLLHDAPGGAWQWHDVARRAARRRRVFVPELPGHGVSPRLRADADPLQASIDRIARLADQLAFDSFDLCGIGSGAVIARKLAAQLPARVHRLLLVDPARLDGATVDELAPSRTPSWDGHHLTAAWFQLRDSRLYRPWCHRRRANARRVGIDLDIAELQQRFVSLVRSGNDHLPLLHAALKDEADHRRTASVILAAEDPDVTTVGAAFAAQGCEVTAASRDLLADAVVSWTESGDACLV